MTSTPPRKLLFSWIGDADLIAWSSEVGGITAETVAKVVGNSSRKIDGGGPIKTLVESTAFDEVHLLCDKSSDLALRFAAWIPPRARNH